jgi:predicted ATP-dependent endonuclease of OLD family
MSKTGSKHELTLRNAGRPLSPGIRAISGIEVDGLFGQVNYSIPGRANSVDFSRLMILYGDNGSGKTTLLSMIFHLLSPANNRGHRNALAEVPFRRFTIHLTDGTVISAERKEATAGPYVVAAEGPKGRVRFEFVNPPPDGKARRFATPDQEKSAIQFLKALEQSLYFLPADRAILGDSVEDKGTVYLDDSGGGREFWRAIRADTNIARAHLHGIVVEDEQQKNSRLISAVDAVNDWLRSQALGAAALGTENSNSIYTHIIQRIARSSSAKSRPANVDVQGLEQRLRMLSERSAEFARFQFTTPLNVDDLLSALSGANDSAASLIASILEPYIDGTNARLDALDTVRRLTSNFVENLNSFYSRKTVSLDVSEGIRIQTNNGQVLKPTQLSSGEQQLLLIFCRVILARSRQSIFIIDEPELSLNSKWQRRLIPALLGMTQDAQVQFIFATHSIELVSEKLENVVRLDPDLVPFAAGDFLEVRNDAPAH